MQSHSIAFDYAINYCNQMSSFSSFCNRLDLSGPSLDYNLDLVRINITIMILGPYLSSSEQVMAATICQLKNRDNVLDAASFEELKT
jgi:hypothetical protein